VVMKRIAFPPGFIVLDNQLDEYILLALRGKICPKCLQHSLMKKGYCLDHDMVDGKDGHTMVVCSICDFKYCINCHHMYGGKVINLVGKPDDEEYFRHQYGEIDDEEGMDD
jgi:hypothetical protein